MSLKWKSENEHEKNEYIYILLLLLLLKMTIIWSWVFYLLSHACEWIIVNEDEGYLIMFQPKYF